MHRTFFFCISVPSLIFSALLLPLTDLFAGQSGANSPASAPQTGGEAPTPERRDIVNGTDSPDIYNYWDPQTRSHVWGVRVPQKKQQDPPPPPIFVTPELKWPYPE